MPIRNAIPIRWGQCFAFVLLPALLAGCTVERPAVGDLFPALPGMRTAAPATPPKPAPPPVEMAGRWLLSSPQGGTCGMNFTVAADGIAGRIAPEGGCPGDFFTSRHWSYEQGRLVIKDHKQQPLARLAASEPPARFEGVATAGLPVTLSR